MEKFYFELEIKQSLLKTSIDSDKVEAIMMALHPIIDRLFNLEDEVESLKERIAVLERG